jgi:DNA primase
MPENILTRKVIEIRKRAAEDRKRRKETEQRQISLEQRNQSENLPDSSNESIPSTSVIDASNAQPLTHKERNILNLIQVLVRYGERVLYQTEEQMITVGEYIITEIKNDSIDIPNPLHQRIIDEYIANYQSQNFVSSSFFHHHSDPAISQLAVDMIADKYQLSRIYSKKSISENVTQEVQQDEVDILPELVQRLLLELKLTVVEERLDAMEKLLAQAVSDKNDQLITAILEQQPQLAEIRKQLCRALGNRVVVR